ncbi:alpha-2-macroglobulin-like [Neoarius graeffei]|uniref:alpha-2-macroglobulin-like n=1 Tax=Neoarius graeffei TaxID=443677 RepID=UPI00298C7FCA|nr:alpha-2-macroglobulin-like [Neoarius graeffei]
MVGLISGEESELAYRDEVERLSEWCKVNNLLLNTTKTKELVTDFRKNKADIQPLIINGACVERVPVFRFLSIELENNLTWSANTKELLKKVQQRLYFLRILRKNCFPQNLLRTFYHCSIESVLTYGLCVCVYLLAVTSLPVGGTTEKLCITVNHCESISLMVSLQYNHKNVTLLQKTLAREENYFCSPFQVPVVTKYTVAFIRIQIEGSRTFLENATKILIRPPEQVLIVKTDKPIYKPGQTVKFRIVSLDSSFLTYNQKFPKIEMEDPNSNIIGQWLNIPTSSGLVDVSYPINSEATEGVYVITVWDKNNNEFTQYFEVKDYVLPKFEVTVQLPPKITILDTYAILKVCAKYAYGKPMNGTVRATVCHNSYKVIPNICRKYKMETDKNGCAERVINLKEFALNDSRSESIVADCEVEEYGTGVIQKISCDSPITAMMHTITFENSLTTFKRGLAYDGMARTEMTNNLRIADLPTPYYPTAKLFLQAFFSESQSFIELKSSLKPFSCNTNAIIKAEYRIQESALRPQQSTLTFYYMVMNKGHLVQEGQIIEAINPGTEHRGELVITLQKMLKVTPVAQVAVYTILPSGEVIADSMNFPIELCLPNKVSLKFSPSVEIPGGNTTLTLRAAPGSLCSVKAIDKSLLLLHPEKDLSIQSVFNMLPVQKLLGYPFMITEEDSNTCQRIPRSFTLEVPQTNYLNNENVDVYSAFKTIGIKIISNANIKRPSACINSVSSPFDTVPMSTSTVFFLSTEASDQPSTTQSEAKTVVSIRSFFPETWIWDLVPVSQSGTIAINKTVPDSITTWQAGAFCTSPDGFGVAPIAEVTAFQPFFVSLTMPSSIIRGEAFTLKATVFNYLQSCMMVKVTLADSHQFFAEIHSKCIEIQCLCAAESWTFSWTITPLVLGEVSISVTAEAIHSSILCGTSKASVPEKGHIDTVIKTLQVKAEGIKQYKAENKLLCPSGGVKEMVSLTLPDVFVNGSAMASVSVLGDLMGRALQNLASLLAMPYDCGEQNILRFAPNIYILDYLKSTNQLTPEIRKKAQNCLRSGYQRQLNYRHNDGSYSAFGMSDKSGNTWLTAIVVKSFGHAKRYIYIDQVHVVRAKTWLSKQQKANGCFTSVGQLFQSNMKGGVNNDVTLTAYITAAMLELNYTITDPVVRNGLKCLMNASAQVNSTYTKALLFYTFTLAGAHGMSTTLMSELDEVAITSGGGRHWSSVNDGIKMDSLEVEMTSYVLLALLSGPQMPGFDLSYSASIVHWLSRQQITFGGFVSTQDTVVALQALAKYSTATYRPEGLITVSVTSPSGLITSFAVTQSNRLLYQESQLKEVPGDYKIKAEGKGCVYVQFTLSYNIPPPPDRSSFSISASVSGNCRIPNPSLNVTITVMYTGQREDTNIVVIEVKPLSGFSVDLNSVQLMNGKSNMTDGVVKRVDQTNGNAIIYLNKEVSCLGMTEKLDWDVLIVYMLNKEVEKVYTLIIVQNLPVKNLKPAVVKVYDYYKPGEKAATEYTSPCSVQ